MAKISSPALLFRFRSYFKNWLFDERAIVLSNIANSINNLTRAARQMDITFMGYSTHKSRITSQLPGNLNFRLQINLKSST
jgi:hypothetical protein